MSYSKFIRHRSAGTPQSEPIPGTVQNSAGGYSFPVDDWTRLDRFLVLGSEGNSYYATAQTLTKENAEAVLRCILADGLRTVARIVEISEAGRAPKNEPAIFALALAISNGDEATRRAAGEALPRVCRIGTHLFHFAEYVEKMRGWGRGLRRAVGNWYMQKKAESVAFQAIKYQQRDGWSHRDLLRLTHPIPGDVKLDSVFRWITQGWEGEVGTDLDLQGAMQMIWAFERAKFAEKPELLKLITDHQLPREALPTEWLNDPDVWNAMLPHLGLTALIRNLGNLSKIGLLAANNPLIVNEIAKRIADGDALHKARVHPIAILSALLTYKQGHGVRGKGTWTPVTKIVDALDAAFYASFDNVEPTGKRIVLALDVSGSMEGSEIAGVPGLTPRVGSVAMALITAAVEKNYELIAFTGGTLGGFSHAFENSVMASLNLSPRQRLDDAIRATSNLRFGRTDCALPMLWASHNKVEADAFVIYTDSETWAGNIHPVEALRKYRQQFGIAAKLIVVGMVSNGFSIADPNDAGMLDVVGFDTSTPQLIADFMRE